MLPGGAKAGGFQRKPFSETRIDDSLVGMFADEHKHEGVPPTSDDRNLLLSLELFHRITYDTYDGCLFND